MRKLVAKFFIIPFIAFNALSVDASLYRIVFSSSNYVDQNDPTVPGSLQGMILIDTSQVGADATYQNGANGDIDIPNWITEASITFTPNDGSSVPAQTRTLTSAQPIIGLRWKPTSGFDPNSEFVGQMTRFSLRNGNDFSTSSSMIQQFGFQGDTSFEEGEFLLSSPVTPVPVPGPLPLLGLAPFAYYLHKLKNKFKKN